MCRRRLGQRNKARGARCPCHGLAPWVTGRRPELRREYDMTQTSDWNSKTIAEFRANEGSVGGPFEGAPIVLVHHRGRKRLRKLLDAL